MHHLHVAHLLDAQHPAVAADAAHLVPAHIAVAVRLLEAVDVHHADVEPAAEGFRARDVVAPDARAEAHVGVVGRGDGGVGGREGENGDDGAWWGGGVSEGQLCEW